MTRLRVAEVCEGSRVSRRDGEALRHLLESHWNDPEPVVLDFEGVVIASVSFFDESFGALAMRHPLDEVTRRIKVEHMQDEDRKLLNTLVLARKREREADMLDTSAIETEFNSYRPKDIRRALHHVGEHPLRGAEKSYDAVTGNGKVKDNQPVAGVRIRRDGESYRFRLTEVSGDNYSWDEIAMKTTSFTGFIDAMRDIVAKSGVMEQQFHHGAASFTYEYDPRTAEVTVKIPGHAAITLELDGTGYHTPRGHFPNGDAIDRLCEAIDDWRQKRPRGPLPTGNGDSPNPRG